MTLEEAMATLPSWVGIWVNIMMIGVFLAPLLLLIWKESRWLGAAALLAGVASFIGVTEMFNQGGYTKLLGFPHILFYTPLAYVYWKKLQSGALSVWPTRIAWVVLITVLISLAFDYTDALRYLLGNRAPIEGTI